MNNNEIDYGLFSEFWKTKEDDYTKIQNNNNFYGQLDKEEEILSYASDALVEFFIKHNITKIDRSTTLYIMMVGQEIYRENTRRKN